jgi:hypothetical protein
MSNCVIISVKFVLTICFVKTFFNFTRNLMHMKSFNSIIFFILFISNSLLAISQTRPGGTPAARPPKGPSPYVLKKDYEAEIQDLKSRIANAAGTAVSVRNSMAGKFDQLIVLDSQMQEVQQILNSANFQIAMNADSLKETRYSMDEFRQKTDEQFATLSKAEQEQQMWLYLLFGIAAAISIIVLVILLSVQQKNMSKLQKMLNQNEEVLKKSLSTGLEKQQTLVKEDLQKMEARLLTDVSIIKREATVQNTKLNEAITTLTSRVTLLEEKGNADKNNQDSSLNNDSGVFI